MTPRAIRSRYQRSTGCSLVNPWPPSSCSRVSPGFWLAPAVTNAGLKAIDIADKFSLVEVPASEASSIIAALRGTKIRGKKVVVREDRGG